MSEIISQEGLRRLIDDWLSQGGQAAGPRRVKPDTVLYSPLRSSAGCLLDGDLRPANSIKDFLFPRHEKLYGYRIDGSRVELFDEHAPAPRQLLIGGRPCDAAALPILDPIFNWDSKDEFYNSRRKAATVVTLACKSYDDACFCTSVGLGPAAERGSDALLFDLGDGDYEVRRLTDKGRRLFEGKTLSSGKTAALPAGPPRRFDSAAVGVFARDNFENPFWQEQTLACLGCGACAYTCPTCHCFDIADEHEGATGARVRNWDTCQFPMFTLHASGHNPRHDQPQRQRQRIYHKFYMYPEKFGEILCTGCGNCARNCVAGLGVLAVAREVANGQHLQA